jgi:hypothetical protein
MSVLDQLRAIEQQVEKRLRELAPLVAEYRDLAKVAERLGLKRGAPEPTDAAAAKPAAKAKAKPKPSGSRTRTTPATRPRAPKSKATASASQSAPAGATTDAASAPKRAPATASRRAKPKPKAKPAAATRGGTADAMTTARPRRNAAAPGQRQRDVLRLVNERPGITVAELAQELSVDATGLYGVVRRLQAKGQISKDGTALRPITETPSTEGTPATTPGEPTPAAPSTPESAAPPSKPPATGS